MVRKRTIIVFIFLGIAYIGITSVVDLPKIIMPEFRLAENTTEPVFLGVDSKQISDYYIYMYDISTKKITTLVSNKAGLFSPSIDDNRVAYISYSDNGPDIHVFDIATGEVKQITSDPYEQDRPQIYKNRVVWEDDRSKYAKGSRVTNILDIYMYDLITDEEIPLITTQLKEMFPEIYGDIVVCEIYSDIAHERIYFYNISSKELKEITSSSQMMGSPKIYMNTVAWTTLLAGGDIFIYDLATGKKMQITDSVENEFDIDIYRNRIVYAKGFFDSGLDIYMYDIGSGVETRITNTPNNLERMPKIYKDIIVYVRREGEYSNIYLYDLKTGEEVRIESPSKFNYLPDIWEDKIVWMAFDISKKGFW
ncbi:MAG: hypothetical protein DRO89_00030 [Candidatus Altiarchaeales archaeon]|nr:MAG: hypothetical protein DRO89_00030 [Candidatus Altiarchaeales archaeon]